MRFPNWRGGSSGCRDADGFASGRGLNYNLPRYRVRAAEGATLEKLCGGDSTVGSNPTGTATENPLHPFFHWEAEGFCFTAATAAVTEVV